MAEGHTLLIPKYHSERMDEVPDEYLSELLPLAKKVAIATGCKDYNIVQVRKPLGFAHRWVGFYLLGIEQWQDRLPACESRSFPCRAKT